MKKILKLPAFLIAAVMLLSLCACSGGDSEYPVKIASYTISEKPDSVVCLSDSAADIIIACGYSSVITMRSDECTQEELEGITSAGSKSDPDTSKIIEENPDVVFADKTISDEAFDELEENGIVVLRMVSASTNDELKLLYKSISAVLGGDVSGRENGESRAEAIITTMNDLQRLIPDSDTVITACYFYDADGNAASDSTFCGNLFSYANVVNVCTSDDYEEAFDIIELSDPQYIFCDTGVKEQILADDRYADFSAVKSGNIYEIDSLEFERQGNSITEVLSYIIGVIYPELSDSSSDESSEQESSEEESSEESSEASVYTSFEITEDMVYGYGDSDDNITEIQQRLVELGFMDDDPTGYFGEVTLAAVEAFEEANGLDVDGELSYDDLILLFSSDAESAQSNSSASD